MQHILGPTHISGNTLDLLITRSAENIFSQVHTSNLRISDHHAIVFKVAFEKLAFERKIILYRKLKAIDTITFNEDILHYTLCTNRETSLTELVSQYELVVAESLDKHAPIITKQVTVQTLAPWYNSKIDDTKHKRCCLERKYKHTSLSIVYDQ